MDCVRGGDPPQESCEEGDKVPIGSRSRVLEEGEDPPPAKSGKPPPARVSRIRLRQRRSSRVPLQPAVTSTQIQCSAGSSGGARGSRLRPWPARSRRRKASICATIAGTGPGGRIIEGRCGGDAGARPPPLHGAAPRPPVSRRPPAHSAPATQATAGAGDQRIPLTGMRTIIAERLLSIKTRSRTSILTSRSTPAPLLPCASRSTHLAAADGNKYTSTISF